MKNVNDYNTLSCFTGIDGLMFTLNERFENAVDASATEWVEENECECGASYDKSHSAQSEAAYYTLRNDDWREETFCARIAAHAVVNCCSRVDLNVNVMDFITVETDECGDEEWLIDEEAAFAAIDAAASTFLAKIA